MVPILRCDINDECCNFFRTRLAAYGNSHTAKKEERKKKKRETTINYADRRPLKCVEFTVLKYAESDPWSFAELYFSKY